MADQVYIVTAAGGVRRFEPRRYWQLNDFARSGRVREGAVVPEGAEVFEGVYACQEEMTPFYFPPRECPRVSVDPAVEGNEAARGVLRKWFGPGVRGDRRVIVMVAADREALAAHEFSVYALDAEAFRRLGSGEFLAGCGASPVSEVRKRDALAAIREEGWGVYFVEGVEALRKFRGELVAAGVRRLSAEKLRGRGVDGRG
jgi:hypothetical protein